MPSRQGILNTLLTSERVSAVTEFIMKCGHEYIKSANEKKREDERFKRFEAAYKRHQDDLLYSSSDEEDERNKQNLKSKAANKKKKEEKKEVVKKNNNDVLIKSAAAAGVLSLSLYSTYQASVQFSEISFHNQLELLIAQVKSILQSTEVWIQEHDKMEDKVPEQVRKDVLELNQLLDLLVRLDPRSNKKVEAAGWGVGALGGLSALGGLALGSATAMTGGAALVVGGAIVMISSKASSKSQLGARILLENQVKEKVAQCQQNALKRERMMEREFQKEQPTYKNNIKQETKNYIIDEPLLGSESSNVKNEPKKKHKQPLYAS